MSRPIPPALKRLDCLDRSSPDFHDQLSNVLYGEQYVQCLPNLQDDGLVWLVDYLDKAFDGLDASSSASRKCLRELRKICGNRTILPTSYTLSTHILDISSDPFASGGSGDVYEGTLDGSRVCLKRVRVYTRDSPEKATKTFCQEAVMWKRLKHPNIVSLLGITVAPLQLISEWMAGGDLPEYITKHSDTDRLGLLSDIAKGLCYLHSCNVIHGDLKGPNVLVDNFGHACITDFGLTMVTRNPDSAQSASCQHGYTPRWAAPEVLNDGTYSKEADIFSFAMVMIEVYTGAIPFNGSPTLTAMLAITQGRRPPRPIHPTFTEILWALMQQCWDHDPCLRPKVSEALQVLSTLEEPAWKQSISNTLDRDECISLISRIFLDHNQANMVRHLSGDDAQTFVDVIDEVLESLEPKVYKKCLQYLCGICGNQALLPRSLEIPLCYNPEENPLCRGICADMWKGHHQGTEVVAKVLRVYSGSDPGQIRRRFCKEVVAWKALHHPNLLPLLGVTMTKNRFVMVSEWMMKGNINEFVKEDINADRLKLLRDATRGLTYIHDQGVIHGNLKGTNILIGYDGCAHLTDFALLTIALDQPATAFSAMFSAMIRWMSPELLDPEGFGLKGGHPSRESDCYALGMVIYEVLSGQKPFASWKDFIVMQRVLEGMRPSRPQGDGGRFFTDGIWDVVGCCWRHQPSDRISAKAALLGLEGDPSH